MPWALLAVALAALGYFAFGRSGPTETGPIQLAVPTPEGIQFQLDTSFPGIPTISPDGRYVVFGGVDEEGEVLLYLRAFDSNQAVALDGTGDAQYPFWSPDSRFIAPSCPSRTRCARTTSMGSQLHISKGCHKDDYCLRVVLPDLIKPLQAFRTFGLSPLKIHVKQYHIKMFFTQFGENFCWVRQDPYIKVQLLQKHTGREEYVMVIVNDQDFMAHGMECSEM